MPVPACFICSKCKGETDMQGLPCVPCSFHNIIKSDGQKHVPSDYYKDNKK
jgi:hypothetical protein